MSNETLLAALNRVSVTLNGRTLLHDIDLHIHQHEQWAIVGTSGSGKTTLANALAGKLFYSGEINLYLNGSARHNGVLLIDQQHRFRNRSNTVDFYYQQRYNAADSEDAVTVAASLEAAGCGAEDGWVDRLQLKPLLEKPLIQLSNGENKRLQLAKALLQDPALLILDNPFTGLDVAGRKMLYGILEDITRHGIHLLLITSVDELPPVITHVAVLEAGRLVHTGPVKELPAAALTQAKTSAIEMAAALQTLPVDTDASFETAVKMTGVTVRYGAKTVLKDIHWQVKRGERWSVSGPNGSGKSTLLSLITADNPQAYANDIWLFDRRRGTGESIWDIKKRIGFVSPELHLFFDAGVPCYEVVASGLFDTIGLFRQMNGTQLEQVNTWLQLTGLQPLRSMPLTRMSLGQQRMALLARALVKNPPLLILDEPCQGLDDAQSAFFKNLLDALCIHFGTTLIYVSHYDKDIPSCVNHSLQLENGEATIA